jgi:3-isopropylmalate/(R)-2-methylmalate dehydratase small subunit
MSLDAAISQLSGRAVPVRGDEIDTDRIVPARFLKEITFERMGEFLFIDARTGDDGKPNNHPLNNSQYDGATVLICGRNFGCGSSREHAPQAVKRYGIKFLVGISFAEIFAGNCKALGMPAVTASEEDINSLFDYVEQNPETEFTLDVAAGTLSYGDQTIQVGMRDDQRKAFLEGTWDAMNLLKANMDRVRETAAALPHMSLG